MLAILGAIDEEVALLRAEMKAVQETVHAGITVMRGDFNGTRNPLAQCGIGKVNATLCTQMLVDLYQPSGMIFSGVAGGLLPNMQSGQAKPQLLDYGVWEVAGGTGSLAKLQGIGTMTIKPASKTKRRFTLTGDLVMAE